MVGTVAPKTTILDGQQNFYLAGNFAPVSREVTEFDLPVLGELPKELNGRYLRNGPNPFGEFDATQHWFFGAGMVHGVRLCEGRAAWYRNRFVGSKQLNASRGLPDIPGPNWNGSPAGPNTSVGGFAGTTWALVESGGCPVELTYELETIGRNDFGGTLPGPFSAHPKIDPQTGEMHALAYAWAQWPTHIQYIVVTPQGRVRKTLDIPMRNMTMLHDMSLTKRYAVIYDNPVSVDRAMAQKGMFPFKFDPNYTNRVGLLPREGRAEDVIWIDVPAGFCSHPMNAYDTDDGGLVIDLIVYDRLFDLDMRGPFGDSASRLERWVLNPQTRRVSTTIIDERSNEFPRHRGSLSSLPYRYGYCASPARDLTSAWPTRKHDLQTGQSLVFDHGPGRAAGEPAFIAREGSAAEDDGYLMMLVHDLANESAELVVIDAQDFHRGYLARVRLPQRVPFGFHGNWVSDTTVAPQP
jgi:carotenoid cleavage dioxygenase-like enzyme